MSAPRTILLTNGDINSLVATAMVLSWPQATALTLLHVGRNQPARDARLTAVRHQAARFSKCRLIEIEEPSPKPEATFARGKATSEAPAAQALPAPLPILRLLTLAMAQAALLDASRIIWPVSFEGDFNRIGRATEQTVLAGNLAAMEMSDPPVIECPLIELTGRQIVELGGQLSVPWEMGWSCDHEGDEPCGICGGCRSRSAAFEAAGVEDPSAKVLARRD